MSMLECRALSKNYGSLEALRSIDLTLESGRIVGLVGPNGSGKTTLIKLAQHLLTPTSGMITIDGMIPGPETKAIVSYLPDRDFIPPWMNLDGLMEFYRTFYGDFNPGKAANMLHALGVNNKQPFAKMSKGTREKVQLIFTMSREARMYLLDEPIAGVDPATRDYILRTILSNYSENALVLISTHLITDVEPILDEVVFLQNGTIGLHENADALREKTGKSIDGYFREVYRCWGN
ncbi:MAG: ABC transporter ATP-binding protein [Lachnospiraceae bacterium]|nr:ABC transporter ATP-binding protein [Lachnospiraceae bacterium]